MAAKIAVKQKQPNAIELISTSAVVLIGVFVCLVSIVCALMILAAKRE